VTIDIPAPLLEKVRNQEIVLFLGAGASVGATHPHGHPVPLGDRLRDLLCDHFLGGALKKKSLAEVADFAMNESDFGAVQSFIRDLFESFGAADHHKLIPQFRWHSVVTTNFDKIIEDAYQNTTNRLQTPVLHLRNGDRIDHDMRRVPDGVPLVKLHGCISVASDKGLPFILSSEQYLKHLINRSNLIDRLRIHAREETILFCGYAISDPHIKQILFALDDDQMSRPRYYAVMHDIDRIEERYWEKNRVTVIKASFADFMKKLDASIPVHSRALPAALGGGTLSIRRHYRVASAAETSGLTAFFEHDVLHVREGFAVPVVEPKEFYRGPDGGWAGINQNLDGARNVTDTVLADVVLREDGGPTGKPELYVLKGPAGSGKTIILKRAAWEAARTFDKVVLWLRDGGALRTAELDEMLGLIQKRFYLFVDRAALNSEVITDLYYYAERRSMPVTIVTAERDSEWNVRCEDLDSLVAKEYPVRPLSEKEIDHLLGKLNEHHALGMLSGLSREDQIAAFLERAERQLLVALYEATQGKPFEDILLDEYQRIVPPEAQVLYLDICTMNRLAVPVRAGLISRISGIRFTDFRERFFRPLAHIVRAYEDRYIRDMVYVARHPHIADIVFQRALPKPDDRFNQLIRVADGLNIGFSSDNTAYRYLFRARNIMDMVSTYELCERFFSHFEHSIGDQAFFHHQRGILEMRHYDGDLAKAAQYLEKAAEIAPRDSTIRHSLANLDRARSMRTDNPVLRQAYRTDARKRLSGLTRDTATNAYGFHTAALIALDELKEIIEVATIGADDPLRDQQVINAAKTVAEVLDRGLGRFSDDTSLLSLQEEYETTLGRAPKAEALLKKTFNTNPRQDWVAVRLARMHLARSDTQGAIDVLKECLTANANSRFANFELAKTLIDDRSDDLDAILHYLRHSFVQGDENHSPQFWYARQLFLMGRTDEAEAYFAHIFRLNVRPSYRNTIRGLVLDGAGEPVWYDGRVEVKEDTYAFVRCTRLPKDIYAPAGSMNSENWERLRRADSVQVKLGFTLRGPCAAEIREVSVMTRSNRIGLESVRG
jgi:tetratricopeptide (TPR) repeat protein